MKLLTNRVLPYTCICVFVVYWLQISNMAMPLNKMQESLAARTPRFKTYFGQSWRLFTPPFTYNNRLYFIIRDTSHQNRSDTIEILEKISQYKQLKAPFNQDENIIDHLVNHNVQGIVKSLWTNKTLPVNFADHKKDSAYIAKRIAIASKNKNYLIYVASIRNYCKRVLKERGIATKGKEVRIEIKQEMTRPFKEMNNEQFKKQERLVFQTPFEPLLHDTD